VKELPAWSAIPAFEIVCDGRVLDIMRLEPAGEVMRIHVSAPGGRQPEVPPGSGRVAVEPSWGELEGAISDIEETIDGITYWPVRGDDTYVRNMRLVLAAAKWAAARTR